MHFPSLTPERLDRDPIRQFDRWFKAASKVRGARYPDAVCLSTLEGGGRSSWPDGRMVLLKSYDASGFVFYTNLKSPKGRSLKARPRAALTFYWESLGRQVRVQGRVVPVSDAEADAYFASRERLSQLGAWASIQSEPLDSRATLLRRAAQFALKFKFGKVPRPPYWSGLRVVPRRIEFWQERPFRLHDRYVYRLIGRRWKFARIYP